MSQTAGSKLVLWLGIIAILATGIIHFIEAPGAFSEGTYEAWLFSLNGLAAMIIAIGMYLKKPWGWNLGLVLAAATIALYVMSRTIGLPGLDPEPEEWLEPLGVASLIVEGLFIILFFKRK